MPKQDNTDVVLVVGTAGRAPGAEASALAKRGAQVKGVGRHANQVHRNRPLLRN